MQKTTFSFAVTCHSIKMKPLLMLWILGLIIGSLAGLSCGDLSRSELLRTLSARPSFVRLLICSIFPFAFTLAAVLCGRGIFVYFLSLVKGFAVSCTGCICLICFGSSGWLVRSFLLYSQIATMPALWYLWLSCCREKERISLSSLGLLLFYVSAVVFLDCYLIAPLLIKLSI